MIAAVTNVQRLFNANNRETSRMSRQIFENGLVVSDFHK